eukprot:scaffold2266_cov112-Isochrysis_galbana.AAC.3
MQPNPYHPGLPGRAVFAAPHSLLLRQRRRLGIERRSARSEIFAPNAAARGGSPPCAQPERISSAGESNSPGAGCRRPQIARGDAAAGCN